MVSDNNVEEGKDFWSSDPRGALDKLLEKLWSRKLMVWLTATVSLFGLGSITSEDWVTISLVYIGSQTVIDFASAWRHGTH